MVEGKEEQGLKEARELLHSGDLKALKKNLWIKNGFYGVWLYHNKNNLEK